MIIQIKNRACNVYSNVSQQYSHKFPYVKIRIETG
uniref:Uncharacterized protein n=1 Tax=Anguilla anguilla TaxID=7936 RepID=A0A0E9T5Y1_ANGAN